MGLVKSRPPHDWRFIHADTFLIEGHIEMRYLPQIPNDFIAVSYTWSPAIKAWRDRVISEGNLYYTVLEEDDEFWKAAETQPDSRRMAKLMKEHSYAAKIWLGSQAVHGILNDANDPNLDEANRFLETVAFMAHSRAQDWFWIDILCIDQDNIQEKEYFVPRMGELYRRAPETHVYLFGTSFPSDLTSPSVYSPLWMTRAWTMQEHLLSQSVFFCYTFAGDVTDDLRKYITHSDPTNPGSPPFEFAEQVLRDDPTRPFESLKAHTIISPDLGCVTTWTTSRHITSCIFEREVERGLGPFIAATLCDKILEVSGDKFNITIKGPAFFNYAVPLYASLFGHVTATERGSPRMLARSMAEISRRQSTIPVDKIYSMLEILGQTNFPVSYSADPQDVRLTIFESMSDEVLGATLATEWGSNLNSGHKDSALPRIYNSSPLPRFEIEELTARAHFSQFVGTIIRAKVGRFRVWMDGKSLVRTMDFQKGIAAMEPLATEERKAGIYCLAVMNAVNVIDHPEYEHSDTKDIPEEVTHAAFLDSASRHSSTAICAIHTIMSPVMEHLPWWGGGSSSGHSVESSFDNARNWREYTSEEVQHALDDLAQYDEVVQLIEVGQCRHTYWYPQEHPLRTGSSVVIGGGNMLDIRGLSGEITEMPVHENVTSSIKRNSSLLALECWPTGVGLECKNRGTVIVEYAGPLMRDIEITLVV